MSEPGYKFDLFFEVSPDLLCIAGYDGYFKKINAAVAKTLGYTMEELYARPINDFVFPEDQEITARVRKELTRSKPLYNFENRYLTKSGDIVWLSWTSMPVESEQVIFAVAKNITHKKKLEEERNMLLANATQINNDLQQITYTTSHDLRAPVNSLLSLFQMMDASKVNDEDTLLLLNYLQLATEQLKQSLNNYVDLLKEKQSGKPRVEEVSLRDTLQRILQSIGALVQTAKATVNADFSAVDKINFNKAYLESIFLNLLTNAIQYTRPDRHPVISISTSRSQDGTQLTFSDNGLGFDMEKVKDKIFGLHNTFHNHADSKGIGLYLVHSHITSLGGKIEVESKVNEGTTFRILFR
jgi:PAS domain S-box-containing protein